MENEGEFFKGIERDKDPLYHLVVGALNSNGGSVFSAAKELRTSEENIARVIGHYNLRSLVQYD